MNTSTLPVDWLTLLAVAGSTLVMFLLARRLMRGMNQQDWILLRRARSRGVDILRPQSVAFIVFAATHETAMELADVLRQDGFETGIKEAQIQYARNKKKPGAPQGGWLITGTRTIKLLPEELARTRKFLDEIALARKAAYLGWQINVAQQQQGPPAAGQ